MRHLIGLIAGLLGMAFPATAASPVDYVRDVKPILRERCSSCHGAIRQKAGLRLDAAELIRKGAESGPVVVPGKSDESELISRVVSTASAERMPPESEGTPLSAEEVSTLRSWIDQGANAPVEKVPDDPRRHWAYQVPSRPRVPIPHAARPMGNPIDAFLADGYEKQGLVANGPVSRDLWLRRVYLDLIGLPPTRAELHAFRSDTAPDAALRVVDRLLASPEYGERWGRHWMDVWRYTDWYGLGAELRFSHFHIWRWRDWIVESLSADKGYDRMVEEMLAGDETAPDDPATLRATGFLVRNWEIFNRNVWMANTVEHTARAFLGVTIQCARCHDHKFDPIAQTDYYRLRSFFEPSHVRIDRVPGQPDRNADGVSRIFDDFLDTPTYLFVRGDETNPSKKKPLTPATPAVLGGPELRIAPVVLPMRASIPDKRAFVIREALGALDQGIAKGKGAVEHARAAATRAGEALASAEKADRAAESKVQAATGSPDAAKPAREAAARAVEQLARARTASRDATEALRGAESALAAAEAHKAMLVAVLAVEKLEDEGGKEKKSNEWTEAAQAASTAQRRLAVLEATHDRLAAQPTLDRAQRVLDGLAASSIDPKTPAVQTALQKASGEAVDARAKLTEAEERLAKAEAAAKAPPTTAYTPRELTFHRAKTTYRGETGNAPYPKISSGRRLALARWMTDRRNPLTARVAVNHIWARHFGEPLVASMFDFGLRTERPVHLELLDWLAVEFIESGWSMKHLHRLIVISSAYAMQSTDGRPRTANVKIDPDNRYLWRMNVKRMEAEVIRDSLLLLAGTLDRRMGGADLPVAQAEEGTRRTIYYRYARDDRIPLLTMFDAPNVEECYRRYETIVPQQALALNNSKALLAKSAEIAAVIAREVGTDDSPATRQFFVISAFERLLGRSPTAEEAAECDRGLSRLAGVFATEKSQVKPSSRARASLVHVLLNHNDFLTIR